MGIFTDIKRHEWTQQEYFNHPAVSNSMLTRMRKEPWTTFQSIPVSDAMKLGSAADAFILTPDQAEDEWFVVDEQINAPSSPQQQDFVRRVLSGSSPEEALGAAYKRPPAGGAEGLLAQFSGYLKMQEKGALSRAEWDRITGMYDAVFAHKAAAQLLKDSDKQVCFTGVHGETGLEVKGMLDMLTRDMEIDLKTTSADLNRVNQYWLADRGYDTQRAMYCALAGVSQAGILIVSSNEPHATRLIDLTPQLEYYTFKLHNLLHEFRYRMDNDHWTNTLAYYKGDGWEVLD